MEVVIFFRFIIIALRITSLCVYCIYIQGNVVVGRIKKALEIESAEKVITFQFSQSQG